MTREVADGVWLLDLGLFPPFATNGYLVDDGELTLVDPGLPVNRPSARTEIADAGYSIADLDRVLITHFDLDHYGGLRELRDEFEGTVYMGADDLSLLRRETHPPTVHHKGLFHRFVRRLFPLDAGLAVEGLADGETVGGFTAYLTPGHNPGHTVYVHESGVAFLGDLVWGDGGALTTPFWLDSYDMVELRESVRAFAERVPPFDVAAMAHGDPLTNDGHRALVDLAARL